MRILIPSIQVPFIHGGAQIHISNLKNALEKFGHQVEVVTFPFKFSPESYIEDLMEYCSKQDFNNFNGYHIDKVISLQFPAYYIKHNNKSLWIMHQHRAVYDLYDKMEQTKELLSLKDKVQSYDNKFLLSTKPIYANSANVAKRLKKYNNIDSKPLYHPPQNEDKFYCDDSYGFIFYPSRLEELKRQDLLIEAMQYTTSDAVAIIAGDGGQKQNYQNLIDKLNLSNKVKLIGFISQKEKETYYARSLAVFFAPYDEDYGYITLEAMLSSKPVITCIDSGGPLEFVEDNKTGFILESDPKIIAKKIDWLYYNSDEAIKLGENGLTNYKDKNISWDNVVKTLLA